MGTEEIKFEHYRSDPSGRVRRYYRGNTPWTPQACGGVTICTIRQDEDEFQGIAICNQIDSFCYNLGRTIALGRARKERRQDQRLSLEELQQEERLKAE